MSYDSYVTRRVVSTGRPGSSYTTYSTPTMSRQYVALETPGRNSSSTRSEESSYSKSYSSTSSSRGGPGDVRTSYESSSRTSSSGGYGPGSSYTITSESRSGGGPGSYFSSTSYRSPYGNNYRSFTTR